MGRRLVDAWAPDFRLRSTEGQEIALSDFRGDKNVVLVFNRGFA